MRTLLINYWYKSLKALRPNQHVRLDSMMIIIEREQTMLFTFQLNWPTIHESSNSKIWFRDWYNYWLNNLLPEPLWTGTKAGDLLKSAYVIQAEALNILIDMSREHPEYVELVSVTKL